MTAEARPLDRAADLHWSARALELALQADYRTSPNPMVGAVIVDAEGYLAGEGSHEAKGQPHAEEVALAQAGERARGGTVYVNLEPCTHVHRKLSCAAALIAAGVNRVVVSMTDPDERVRGAGIRTLTEAGIKTTVGLHEDRARRLNEFYIKHRLTGRPFVSVKYAMSLDGKIATRTGESRWISGEESRHHSHRLRHQHDAILVGINTVLADDPELTARLDDPGVRQPLRIVLDSRLRISRSARVIGANTLIASTRPGRVGAAEVLKLPAGPDGRIDLAALFDELGDRNVLSVLAEGGAEVHASLFAQGFVDKVYAYVAPKLIGGRDAPGPIAGTGIAALDKAMRVKDVDFVRLGDDILISGYVEDVHRDS